MTPDLVHARQGDRRRFPAGCDRWPRRHHEAFRQVGGGRGRVHRCRSARCRAIQLHLWRASTTLDILKRPGAYETLWRTGRKLMDTLQRMLKEARIPAQIIGEAPMFDVVFSTDPISDYRGYFKGNTEMARRFNATLLKHGVLKSDLKYHISIAHNDEDVATTIKAWEAAIAELRG